MPASDTEATLDLGETTLTSKGQITVPSALRQAFELAAGDRLQFIRDADGRIIVKPRKRRRIVDFARANPIRLNDPNADLDTLIDEAVTEAMAEKLAKSRGGGA